MIISFEKDQCLAFWGSGISENNAELVLGKLLGYFRFGMLLKLKLSLIYLLDCYAIMNFSVNYNEFSGSR